MITLKREITDSLLNDVLADSPQSEGLAKKLLRRYRASPTPKNKQDFLTALELLPPARKDEIRKHVKLWSA